MCEHLHPHPFQGHNRALAAERDAHILEHLCYPVLYTICLFLPRQKTPPSITNEDVSYIEPILNTHTQTPPAPTIHGHPHKPYPFLISHVLMKSLHLRMSVGCYCSLHKHTYCGSIPEPQNHWRLLSEGCGQLAQEQTAAKTLSH